MAKNWVWNQGHYGYRCRHCSNLDWLAYQEAEDVRKQAEYDALWCCDGALVPLLDAGELNDTADHESAGGLNEVADSPRYGHIDGVHLPAGDPAREQTDDATDGSSNSEAGGSLYRMYIDNWDLESEVSVEPEVRGEPAPEPGVSGEPRTATEQCLASKNDLSMSEDSNVCSISGPCLSEESFLQDLADDDSLPVHQDVETMDCSCGATFATDAVSCPECGTSTELIIAENQIERQVNAYLEAEAALKSGATLRGTSDFTRLLAANMADTDRLDADDADRLDADDADDALVGDDQWEADYEATVQQFCLCLDASTQGHASDALSTTVMNSADHIHFGDSVCEVAD